MKPRRNGGSITDSDSDSQAENHQTLNVQPTTGVPLEEAQSPLISIRMKVSSATQTEDISPQYAEESKSQQPGGRVLIDADSGGSSVKPAAAPQAIQTTTEPPGSEPQSTTAT